jgi:hypothetical protein
MAIVSLKELRGPLWLLAGAVAAGVIIWAFCNCH